MTKQRPANCARTWLSPGAPCAHTTEFSTPSERGWTRGPGLGTSRSGCTAEVEGLEHIRSSRRASRAASRARQRTPGDRMCATCREHAAESELGLDHRLSGVSGRTDDEPEIISWWRW
jgi:hypothetical protein